MKIRSNVQGRTVALINLDEVLPQQGFHAPDALPLIVQRYGFVVAPNLSDSIHKAREEGFKFETGKLILPNQQHSIHDFTVWSDGFVVNAYTTESGEAFLGDFLTWGSQNLGFRLTLPMITKRLYVNQLVVEFDYAPAGKLMALHPICKAYNEALRRVYGFELPPTESVTLKFDYDHAVAPSAFRTVAPFVVERRENHRFHEDNVFFTQAPLPTADHIKLIEDFERLLS
jgi:hypothetical protein